MLHFGSFQYIHHSFFWSCIWKGDHGDYEVGNLQLGTYPSGWKNLAYTHRGRSDEYSWDPYEGSFLAASKAKYRFQPRTVMRKPFHETEHVKSTIVSVKKDSEHDVPECFMDLNTSQHNIENGADK